jgi:hypothetical protein
MVGPKLTPVRLLNFNGSRLPTWADRVPSAPRLDCLKRPWPKLDPNPSLRKLEAVPKLRRRSPQFESNCRIKLTAQTVTNKL